MVQFRKSKALGPFRLTVSKKGLGVSAGAGPLRVSRGADGTIRRTASAPGTGIYDTKVVHRPKSRESSNDSGIAATQAPRAATVPTFRYAIISLLEPVTFRGAGSEILFDGRSVRIEHSGLRAKVNGLKTIDVPITDVAEVIWEAPTVLMKGNLRFVLADVKPNPAHLADPMKDPLTVYATPRQAKSVNFILDVLDFSKQHGTP